MYSNIISSVLLATILGFSHAQTTTEPITGTLGNATIPEDNPVGPIYVAELPDTEFFNPDDPRGNIKGSVSAKANPDGIGVQFQIQFSNLPTSGGPFIYHLHSTPVPTDGNCTGTLGHLDPFLRGEMPACNESLPQTCQVGDLSGKHGKITSDPFQASYVDEFASTLPGLGSFFGNRSLVIHFGNKTRITCANFTLLDGVIGGEDGDDKTNSTRAGANGTATSTGGPLQYTGSGVAGKLSVQGSLLAALGAALVFAL
ncbi:hypothetical protein MFRU_005g03090 [Monilinia fructicola]|uniref:superoxide dismutase n=1 Tax=Monilinia fructicola TaxID=38448 RepID=A0A5M9JL10_MONFR|nr:hypothetical protein EYC84_002511 [Monilinia fructicola]KAG4033297.1 hypothetical protein MFRU_005g03090 [Monilinia fructicola]